MATESVQKTKTKFQLTIAKDSMSVNIIVKRPQPNEFPPNIDEILAGLEAEGVIYGILEDSIKKVISEQVYNNPVRIAEGLKPKTGINSEIEYKFDTAQSHKPQVDDDGRIDYKNINFIQNVEEGGVLAIRIPAKPGLPGKNVLGKELKGPDGRNIPFKNGSNTIVSEDGNTLTASCSGAIVFLYDKVSVNDVMLIKGDVDFNVGNFQNIVIFRIT